MGNQPWLDEVRNRLARHGLPPTYVDRFLAELTDHLHDLQEETTATEADPVSRLGQPAQVAEAAVAAYRRRSFLGRHPAAALLVFAVSPVLPQFVLFVLLAQVLMTVKGDHVLRWDENHWISVLPARKGIRLGPELDARLLSGGRRVGNKNALRDVQLGTGRPVADRAADVDRSRPDPGSPGDRLVVHPA